MRILDILNSPWMIREQVLRDMIQAYQLHLLREKIDFNALNQGGDAMGQEKRYQIKNGVAVIPVKGVLTPSNSFFSKFFGGTSYTDIQAAIEEANNDSKVSNILQHMNSPGGSVELSFETSDVIRSSKKPVYTFSDGSLASSAAMLAAPSKLIKITGKANPVGSIGVIATHVDFSKMDQEMGVVKTEIVSGKYKNMYSSARPLSEEARENLQSEVDYLATLFINDFADDRKLDREVVANWQAKVFIGGQAIQNGLVDGVSTLSDFINEISGKKIIVPVAGMPEQEHEKGVKTMELTFEVLKTKYPEIYEQTIQTGKDLQKTEDGGLYEKGVNDERARITGIRKEMLPGQESIADQCVKDGSTIMQAMSMFLAAERQTLSTQSTIQALERPKSVNTDVSTTPKESDLGTGKVDQNAPLEVKAKQAWDSDKKLQDEFFGNFESYKAYLIAESEGRARIKKN